MINYTLIKKLFLLLVFTLLILNKNVQAQTVITYGQVVSGSISVAAEKDAYTFNGISGEKVTIRFAKTSGTILPYAQLYNPAGGLVTSSSSGAITASLTSTGIFKITIADYGNVNIGDYSLSIQRTNNPVGATALSFGQVVSGSIDSVCRIRAYSFSATANDTITVRSAVVTQTAGFFQVNIELYDAAGTLLTSTSSGSLTKKVITTGNYYLLVTDYYRDGTGTYTLSSQRTNNPVGATALSFGQIVSGSIDSFSRIRSYSFSATANDTITIRSAVVTQTAGFFQVNVELYDAAGTLLTSTSSGSLTRKVAATGNYYLLVTDYYRDGTGTYTLSSQRVNNPTGATALSFGQVVSGSIDSVCRIRSYSFSAVANDTITIRSAVVTQTAGFFQVNIELYDAAGTLLTSTSSGSLTRKVATTGSYYLLVTDYYRDGTGTYTLSLQRVNNPTGYTALSFGQVVSGSIDSFSRIRSYSFSAVANDTITVRSAVVTQTAGFFQVNIELYDAAGTLLTSISSGSLTQKVATTGSYYLLVTDYYRDGTGTFECSLQRVNNPAGAVTISYNTIKQDSLDFVTRLRAYKITAQALDKITFCSAVKAGAVNLDLFVELFDISGTRLTYGYGSFKYTFPVSGTFYIFVSDYGRDGTGTYRFTVVKSDVSCSTIDLIEPQVVLLAPKPAEIVENNSSYGISWTSSDNVGVTWQEIRFSTDGGVTYPVIIATGLAGNVYSYNWSIPATTASIQARIKIIARDAKGNQASDSGKGVFIIVNTALPAGSVNATYQYDKQNRLIQSNDGSSNVTYTYDQADNRLNLNKN